MTSREIEFQKYELTPDAIRAMNALVESRFKKLLSDSTFDSKIMSMYTERLDKYMMKQYPDLSNRLNSVSLLLDEQAKNLSKSLKEIEKREKKLIKSESVYEDIYEMKDRMKVLDDFIITFKSKLKKAFDL